MTIPDESFRSADCRKWNIHSIFAGKREDIMARNYSMLGPDGARAVETGLPPPSGITPTCRART
jgi:hypothetical protein